MVMVEVELQQQLPLLTLGGGASVTSNYNGISWGNANRKYMSPCLGGIDEEVSNSFHLYIVAHIQPLAHIS